MPYHLSRALGRHGNRVTLLTSRRKRGQCVKATLQEGTEPGEAVEWVEGLLERRVQRYDLDFLDSSSLQGGMNLTHTGHRIQQDVGGACQSVFWEGEVSDHHADRFGQGSRRVGAQGRLSVGGEALSPILDNRFRR